MNQDLTVNGRGELPLYVSFNSAPVEVTFDLDKIAMYGLKNLNIIIDGKTFTFSRSEILDICMCLKRGI